MNSPYEIIKLDQYTGKIEPPSLLLMNRSFHIIGKISRYENWNISLVGNGMDEISFDVHKYADGILCPVWDDLIDLKIIDVSGFGRFEISVDYTDSSETIKSIHGFSLETELAQIGLYEFHVNDEDAADMEVTEYSKDNYDSDGNFIPTTFYNPEKPKHSLLHRVLADKAPHWSIGYVTPYITMDEKSQPQLSSEFQRTYTVDGDTIYDFLTGTVAEESNVVFVFDTASRKINCYSLCDCIDQTTGKIITYKGKEVTAIGEDTMVLVSKNKLANETTISSNKDNVKNCFRIEGGDDVITDMVRAVNMNGSNYIYQFADFQYNDMSESLREKLESYQDMMSDEDTQDAYYGENGIYTKLCKAYDDLAYYKSAMMPNTDKVIEPGKAEDQYEKIVNELTAEDFFVAVSSLNKYDDNLFVGVTKNVEAYAQVFLDSRFDLEIVKDTASYSYNEDEKIGTWKGKIRITQHTDKTNVYPVDVDKASLLEIKVNEDVLEFAKQKVHKALSKASLADIDFDVAEMDEDGVREYFNQYSLNRLESFFDAYNSCISVLAALGQTTTSEVRNDLYDTYERRYKIIESVKEERQEQVDEINQKISDLQKEQKQFQEDHDFQFHLGEHYQEFCKYRRENTYSNSNYISDGLTDSECLQKAKELIEAAEKEAKKACVLQRTVSTSMNNLFALPEFEPFYDKFALYNYIRIRTEDEILKLRLIGIDFRGDAPEDIDVTFSEQIESIDGALSDLRSIIQQAGSMATSYPSTVLQAEQGTKANHEINDMYANGLNAAKTMLKNNDSNEVTVTSSGILCKRMDDEGFYGNKQLRITGNIMAFTDDSWESVKMAVGETKFTDPVTGNEKQGYGIIADNIVGKFIASEKMYIGNKTGSVLITGDGIRIDKGTISWSGVNAPVINDIDGLSEFKNKVNAALTGSSATEIGSDYVISPKIGGGYLYIKDKRTASDKTGTSIEINPNGTHFTGHNGEYVFNISKNNGKDLIMGVDNKGNGYFSGNITGSKITGSHIVTEYEDKTTGEKSSTNITNGLFKNSGYFGGDYRDLTIIDGNINIKKNDDASCRLDADIFRLYKKKKETDENNYNYGQFCIDLQQEEIETNLKTIIENNVKISKALNVDGNVTVGNGLGTIYGFLDSTSDRNLKDNIKPLTEKHMRFFSLLQPVSFTYKDGNSGKTHIGFISQDVEEAMHKAGLAELDFAGFSRRIKTVTKTDGNGLETEVPDLDENGNVQYIYSLKYNEFIAINTYMVQNLLNKTKLLESTIELLGNRTGKLEQENFELRQKVKKLENILAEIVK